MMSEHRSAVFVPQPVAVRRLPPVKMHATLMAARAAPPMPSSFQSALPAVVPISESDRPPPADAAEKQPAKQATAPPPALTENAGMELVSPSEPAMKPMPSVERTTAASTASTGTSHGQQPRSTGILPETAEFSPELVANSSGLTVHLATAAPDIALEPPLPPQVNAIGNYGAPAAAHGQPQRISSQLSGDLHPVPPAPARKKRMSRREAEIVAACDRRFEAMDSAGQERVADAARYVQRFWRETVSHTMYIEKLRREHFKPSLDKARRHAISFLPKDRHGQLYPIWTPFKSFHSMGCGVALYMYVLHWWSALFFALAIITSSLLFLYCEGAGMSPGTRNLYTIHALGNWGTYLDLNRSAVFEVWLIMPFTGATTFGGVGRRLNDENSSGDASPGFPQQMEPLPASFGAVEVLVALLLTWFTYWQSNQVTNLSQRITHVDTTSANYTVMVSRMPTRRVPHAEIAGYFARWGDVVHVHVVCHYRDLILAARERSAAREALHAAHVEWHLAKTNSYPHSKLMRCVDKVARAKRRLARAHAAVRSVASVDPQPTGHVFVTFDTVDSAVACIADNDEKRFFSGAGPLLLRMAPEPEDIIWENLQYSLASRMTRYVLTSALLTALVIFNTAAISVTQVWQQQTVERFSSGGPGAPDFLALAAVTGVALGVLLFGYISMLASVPLVAYHFEKWQQFQNREVNIMMRLALFQILIPTASITLFAVLNDYQMAAAWYLRGGGTIINSLAVDLVLVNMGVDYFRIDVWFFRKVLAPRAKTQRRMNALYKRDADIYLSFRLQLMCKFFVCGLLYSTAFPILYLICFATYCIGSLVDRTNFLRVWAPPPPTSNRLIAIVTRVIVPITVLLHTVMAFLLFRAVDETRATGWSTASTLACVAIGLSAPPILYFLLREHSTRAGGQRIGIVPENRLKTFREWFLDLKEDGGAGQASGRRWMPTETFRETSDLGHYVPPLGRALLIEAGVELALQNGGAPLAMARRPSVASCSGRQRRDSAESFGLCGGRAVSTGAEQDESDERDLEPPKRIGLNHSASAATLDCGHRLPSFRPAPLVVEGEDIVAPRPYTTQGRMEAVLDTPQHLPRTQPREFRSEPGAFGRALGRAQSTLD